MLPCLFLNLVCFSQRGPLKPAVSGVVTGHVFCEDTNGPARLANVVLEPAEAIDGFDAGAGKGVSAHLTGVQTLLDGSFSFQHVAPGAYYIFASAPGYVSPLATVAATPEQLSKPDKETKEAFARAVPRITVQANLPAAIDVTLRRGAAVSGTVLYDDGSPAAGLKVRVLVQKKDKWVVPRLEPVQDFVSVTTDDRGVFRIVSLPGREYLLAVELSVSRTGYDISSEGGFGSFYEDESKMLVYSGSKLRANQGVPFTLKLGEERPGEDITVPLAKLHGVSGSVVASRDGHVLNGGTVALRYADDRSEVASTTLSKGETVWSMNFVPEGDYIVQVIGGVDAEYEELANPAGTTPPTRTESHVVHAYGLGEQPLHVDGDVSGLAVSVPEMRKTQVRN